MASNKVWNVTYYLGNTNRVVTAAGGPMDRLEALQAAGKIERNGWRVWVEHHLTKDRVYDSNGDAPLLSVPGKYLNN